MTKPSDFIFNSDYLALAETGRNQYKLILPARGYDQVTYGQNQFDQITFYTTTLNCPVDKSAIESYQVTYNGKTFLTDTIYSLAPWNTTPGGVFDPAYWLFVINRKDANTLEIKMVFVPELWSEGATIPALTFDISVCSFKPPNVF